MMTGALYPHLWWRMILMQVELINEIQSPHDATRDLILCTSSIK